MTLIIIPTYMANEDHYAMTAQTITALRKQTGEGHELMVIDDCSPRKDLVRQLDDHILGGPGLGRTIARRKVNGGFAKAVNQGLVAAREDGQDALILNADVHIADGCLEALERSTADVTGGLLLYPNGLIQHAGIYFSVIFRTFDHRHRFAPGKLGVANVPSRCPVTGAMMLIKNRALHEFGLMDEGFKMGWEDVDYCLRVQQQGGICLYNPQAKAIHFERFFSTESRKEKEEKGVKYLHRKHRATDLSWVPNMLTEEAFT